MEAVPQGPPENWGGGTPESPRELGRRPLGSPTAGVNNPRDLKEAPRIPQNWGPPPPAVWGILEATSPSCLVDTGGLIPSCLLDTVGLLPQTAGEAAPPALHISHPTHKARQIPCSKAGGSSWREAQSRAPHQASLGRGAWGDLGGRTGGQINT